ncbi:MAG TPA: glycoside hydrolase family 15 protein, partial [Actinomycetota bacterium]|nr:glycoside hydrolase family 15 protein [Actinomycetota bacterium]
MDLPIADYALIGDTRTAALCSSQGSIDWLCVPRFESDPVFGRLIGGERAGRFFIAPEGVRSTSRSYRRDSAVLDTTWRTETGELILTEGMVLDVQKRLLPQALLVRRVRCTNGTATLRINFDPKLGLPGRSPRSERRNGDLVCTWGSLAVALRSQPDLALRPGQERIVELRAGEQLTLVMTMADRAPLVLISPDAAFAELARTDAWWQQWSSGLSYEGEFRDPVARSLITLRLLTYSPSGAPVAAPTTSLPEVLGGSRNWDYRLSWPRDASIGIGAFLGVGKTEEAHSFMHWLLHASRLTRPRLGVLYTIYGKPGPMETDLNEVAGYEGSRPVRTGNAASSQHQLDVYGWVVDAAWLLSHSNKGLQSETRRAVAGLANFVSRTWREPDAGIWEVRGEPRPYVHSKLMAWVTLDRAIRIDQNNGGRSRRHRHWVAERAALALDIQEHGYSAKHNTYVWRYGSEQVDAALLILPIVEFENTTSARLAGTVAAIRRELDAGDGLLYRYAPGADDLDGAEGAFLPCPFWLVQALARVGQIEEAKGLFERLLGLANDVGLFS